MKSTGSIVITAGLVLALGGGCAQFKEHLKNPHPMEHNFGHTLFNESPGFYPALKKRQPAAPKEIETPRRIAEGEKRPLRVPGQEDPADVANANPAPHLTPAPHESSSAPHGEAPLEVIGPSASDTAIPPVPTKPKGPKITSDRGLQIEEVSPEPAAPVEAPPAGLGDGSIPSEMLAAAKRLVGIHSNYDEQGFVTHILQVAAVEVQPEEGQDIVRALYEKLNSTDRVFGPGKTPKAGDLVFFHNTQDRDQDGRADDWFTMAGVVEHVGSDGTVTFIGFARGAVRRMDMNLRRPGVRRDETAQKDLNALLRTKSLTDRPFTVYLAGELFASYGSLR